MVQHVVGLVTIAAAAGCYVLPGSLGVDIDARGHDFTIVVVWRLVEGFDGACLRCVTYLEPPDSCDSKFSSTTKKFKKFGRLLVILALEAQCIGAIVLYSRRRKQGAVTRADRRVFELAYGGVVITLLTIGVVVKLPLFRKKVSDRNLSVFEDIVFHLRFASRKVGETRVPHPVWQL